MRSQPTCFNLRVIRGALGAGLLVLCSGCSNVLGADFDPEEVGDPHLSVTLAPHPHDALSTIPLTGSGRVISEDGEIDCGSDCVAVHPVGSKQSVKLTAIPDDGSAFAGWHATSCPNSRATSCTVGPLERDETVDAYFVKNGANVWQFSVGGAGSDLRSAIAVADDGETYALGSFQGPLALPGTQLANIGEADVFLLHLDATGDLVNETGDVPARTVAGKFTERPRGLALASTGPVMIATTTGNEKELAEISPFGEVAVGESDGIVASFDDNLGVRWHAITQGGGIQTFDFLAVDDDDGTHVLGTTRGQMTIASWGVEASDESDIVLTSFDADGSVESMRNLGGTTPLAVSTLHESSDVLVAGVPFDTGGVFTSCPPAKFVGNQYVMRFDPLGNVCRDLLTFPPEFELGPLLTTEDDHVVLIGWLHDAVLDFDSSDPKAYIDVGQDGGYVVVSLGSELQWLPGESWIQLVTGDSKLSAAGVGREIVLSLSSKTDTHVGDEIVPYLSKRGLTFVALGLDGHVLWHRSFGEVSGGVANEIVWHAPSHGWFFAGTVQVDQPSLLDLENVTQAPLPLDGRKALFGRFAP